MCMAVRVVLSYIGGIGCWFHLTIFECEDLHIRQLHYKNAKSLFGRGLGRRIVCAQAKIQFVIIEGFIQVGFLSNCVLVTLIFWNNKEIN